MTMTEPITPAEIRAIMAARGWTRKQLAAACNVSLRAVENWLTATPSRRVPRGPAVLVLRQIRDSPPPAGPDRGRV